MTRRLKLIEVSYASLKKQAVYPASLMARLSKEASARSDIYEKQLFFMAMATSIQYFGPQAEKQVCKVMPKMDIYTQHRAAEKVRRFKGNQNPFLTPEGKINRAANPSAKGPTLCAKPLYYHPMPSLASKAAMAAPKVSKNPVTQQRIGKGK